MAPRERVCDATGSKLLARSMRGMASVEVLEVSPRLGVSRLCDLSPSHDLGLDLCGYRLITRKRFELSLSFSFSFSWECLMTLEAAACLVAWADLASQANGALKL